MPFKIIRTAFDHIAHGNEVNRFIEAHTVTNIQSSVAVREDIDGCYEVFYTFIVYEEIKLENTEKC